MAEFKPSVYQTAVFDWVRTSAQGAALLINARAGAGKTSTLVEAAKLLPPDTKADALFCAFNKSIAESLAQRLPGMQCRTIHSLGMNVLTQNIRPLNGSRWVDGRKYHKLAKLYCRQNRIANQDFEAALVSLVHFSMMTLTEPGLANLKAHALKYDIRFEDKDWPAMEKAVPVLLKWGVEGTPDFGRDTYDGMRQGISFDDMVYLPTAQGYALPKFSFIMVDEAQDLNAAQLELVLSCRRAGTRLIFCGDPQQAIYGFTGADIKSFFTIKERTGAEEVSLPICYRCPRLVIEKAQEIVPDILSRENAPDGEVGNVSGEELYAQLQAAVDTARATGKSVDAAILCRLTAPLIEQCFALIRREIPAKVRGRDIGAQLIALIETVSKLSGYSFEGFVKSLNDYREITASILAQKGESAEYQVAALHDKCDSLEILFTNAFGKSKAYNTETFCAYVEGLFTDEVNGSVLLCTVHKAKGLEWKKVYILNPELMPFHRAKGELAAQEYNLMYVAYTRALEGLYFIGAAPAPQTPTEPGVAAGTGILALAPGTTQEGEELLTPEEAADVEEAVDKLMAILEKAGAGQDSGKELQGWARAQSKAAQPAPNDAVAYVYKPLPDREEDANDPLEAIFRAVGV